MGKTTWFGILIPPISAGGVACDGSVANRVGGLGQGLVAVRRPERSFLSLQSPGISFSLDRIVRRGKLYSFPDEPRTDVEDADDFCDKGGAVRPAFIVDPLCHPETMRSATPRRIHDDHLRMGLL